MPTETARLRRERRALMELLQELATSLERFTERWGGEGDEDEQGEGET